MKTSESKPITLALPTNSRIAADLAPLYDAIEVSPEKGTQRSARLSNTIIRFTRGQDIIKNLLDDEGTFNFGIVGEDTAIEEGLTRNPPDELSEYTIDPIMKFPSLGKPTSMCLLGRREQIQERSNESLQQRKIPPLLLTSYPNIAWTMLNLKRFPIDVIIKQIDGGVEKALRCGDYGPNALFAVDIVRTGKTIEEEGLVTIGDPFCISSPVLFEKIPRITRKRGQTWQREYEDVLTNFNWRSELLELIESASIQVQPMREPITTQY